MSSGRARPARAAARDSSCSGLTRTSLRARRIDSGAEHDRPEPPELHLCGRAAGAAVPAHHGIDVHPSAHAANANAEEFEYIELRNISTNTAVSLLGVRFVNGVDFNFAGSAVTSLAAGARVLW
jgi:hypothetical protein